MSWVPAEQVLSTVAAQRRVLDEQQARIAHATKEHAAQRQKLEAERAQAVHDLGQAVLQKLDVPSIAKAAQTVGLVGLPNENVVGKLGIIFCLGPIGHSLIIEIVGLNTISLIGQPHCHQG